MHASLAKACVKINDTKGVDSTEIGMAYGADWRPETEAVLKDKNVRASLARYFDVAQDEKPANFLIQRALKKSKTL